MDDPLQLLALLSIWHPSNSHHRNMGCRAPQEGESPFWPRGVARPGGRSRLLSLLILLLLSALLLLINLKTNHQSDPLLPIFMMLHTNLEC